MHGGARPSGCAVLHAKLRDVPRARRPRGCAILESIEAGARQSDPPALLACATDFGKCLALSATRAIGGRYINSSVRVQEHLESGAPIHGESSLETCSPGHQHTHDPVAEVPRGQRDRNSRSRHGARGAVPKGRGAERNWAAGSRYRSSATAPLRARSEPANGPLEVGGLSRTAGGCTLKSQKGWRRTRSTPRGGRADATLEFILVTTPAAGCDKGGSSASRPDVQVGPGQTRMTFPTHFDKPIRSRRRSARPRAMNLCYAVYPLLIGRRRGRADGERNRAPSRRSRPSGRELPGAVHGT